MISRCNCIIKMCHGHLLSDVQLVMHGNIQSVSSGYRCLNRDPIYIQLICTNEGGWNATCRYPVFMGFFFCLHVHLTELNCATWEEKSESGLLNSAIFSSQSTSFAIFLLLCLFVCLCSLLYTVMVLSTWPIQTEKEINCKRHSVWKHWRVPRLTSFITPISSTWSEHWWQRLLVQRTNDALWESVSVLLKHDFRLL